MTYCSTSVSQIVDVNYLLLMSPFISLMLVWRSVIRNKRIQWCGMMRQSPHCSFRHPWLHCDPRTRTAAGPEENKKLTSPALGNGWARPMNAKATGPSLGGIGP
ncbi:hypothetical protein CEXT_168071 [Caerostris extrusa]|uniref:Uncharacterized protein n=1 Tax=Caerostris extrusa TaxID=172846 RepID=A0AAV4N0U9_CAEEX|nr:hypothetical protein CEXT_168071 [Caerostris extrusa]